MLVFAATLLAAALLSELAQRSVLSTAAVFLVVGFVTGPGMLGLIPVRAGGEVVGRFAELALFAVLFTDGMRVDASELRRRWLVPGRALLLGMPLTLGITAALAHLFMAWGAAELHLGRLALEVLGGIGLGVALPWAAALVERSRFFSVGRSYEPMFAFAVGLLLFATASLTHANEYLAAFAGGATISVKHPVLADAFARFGESVAELLKLAAVMVFGALISPGGLGHVGLGDVAFVVLTLALARPLGLGLALLGSRTSGRELGAALWFGPKGFASVVFGLLVLHSGLPSADRVFQLVALVVAASILAHSSTDVLVAKRLEMPDADEGARDASAGDGS